MCIRDSTHTGKLYDSLGQGIEAEFISFPNDEKIVDLACAAQFMVALSDSGNVYYWGKMQVHCGYLYVHAITIKLEDYSVESGYVLAR